MLDKIVDFLKKYVVKSKSKNYYTIIYKNKNSSNKNLDNI